MMPTEGSSQEPLIPFKRREPPPMKEFAGLQKLADEASHNRTPAREEGSGSSEITEALSRLKATELPAPVMAVAASLLTCAHEAANDMEAQAAHLEDEALNLRQDAKALREEGKAHSEGIQSVARNIKAGTARARSAIALAHQARTGSGAS